MESYITLSNLNDFIFCPRSIYFHQLYSNFNDALYKQKPQVAGAEAHTAIDAKTYSTKVNILMGIEVYSQQYNIVGKIDVFDSNTGTLTERKRSIKTIYDGYVFQVYAQYFAMQEMGYTVHKIVIHDLVHNKNYPIPLPVNDKVMFEKFETLIQHITNYNLNDDAFVPNLKKCTNCIYNQLCDKSLC
jgi:CRISPR-associated exonuclease Cas4